VSPIYVRPAREQSEHDRLIRHLQIKYKRKFDAAINIDGLEPPTPVKLGAGTFYPDVVLTSAKKLAGLVEVETGESVNNLEVMAQWVHFSKARVPFHLYVPVHGYEAAKRLCDGYHVSVSELWTYRPTHEGFDLVRMHADASAARTPATASAGPARAKPAVPAVAAPKPDVKPAPKAAAPAVKPTKPAPKAKPAARPKPARVTVKSKPAKPAARPAAKAKKPVAAVSNGKKNKNNKKTPARRR
jgi:hypothetical protein